jgi:hypothetical protein
VAVADEDSELSLAIHDGGFGRTVPPGDAAGLATVLRNLGTSRTQLAAWARRTDWVRQFSREKILPRFEQMLLAVAPVPALASVAPVPATVEVKVVPVV